MLPDFNLESPKVVVFITSHSSWEWVLVAEVAQFLKSEGRHVVVHYLDISFPWNRTNSDPKEMLARKLFDTEKIELRPTVHRIFKLKLIPPVTKKLILDHESLLGSLAFPTLVDKLKIWKIRMNSIPRYSSVVREISLANYLYTTFSRQYFEEFDQVYVVNGRYTASRTLRAAAKNYGKEVFVVDFGAAGDRFRVFSESAQSSEDVENQTKTQWDDANVKEREQVARKYFSSRRSIDPHSGISWTAQMNQNYVPKIPPNKKVCVLYATSQIEFAGENAPSPDTFQSQDEAFSSVAELLPASEWIIYLRKHPRSPSHTGWSDNEDQLAKIFDFHHVEVIPSDSSIDSYALASKANLVVVFGSSIGAEIAYAELAPVISLTHTSWRYLAPDNHVTNRLELSEYISKGALHGFKKIPGDRLLPWGYYGAMGGVPFKFFKLNQETREYFVGSELS